MVDIRDFLARLRNVKKVGDGWTALCPVHNDRENSLSVAEKGDRILVFCHANKGCDWQDVFKAVGMWKEKEVKKPDVQKRIVAEYDYISEDGELLYQVVRTEPKGFMQRRPVGEDGWDYKLKGIRRVLYNLPEIIERKNETIFVVEGEKDADNLMKRGLLATTNAGGAGKWLKDYNKYFRNRIVVIIPDNDSAGESHAEEVAKNLYKGAQSVKILRLTGLDEKEDVSDWIEVNSNEDLDTLISQTPVFEWDGEDYDEELPHDLEAESAVLGAIQKDNKLIGKTIEAEFQKYVYSPKHKTIYKAMLTLFNEGVSIDNITVTDRLRTEGTLEKVGGEAYIKLIRDEVPETMAVEHWISIVTSKAQLRSLIELSNKVKSNAYGEIDTPQNLGDEVVKTVFGIKTDKKQGFSSLASITDRVLVKAREQIAQGITGRPTGFAEFDRITSGLQDTDLILIAGRPSMGKTAIALNMITHDALRNNGSVACFSLEMDKDALVRRILCSEARVDAQAFRNGTLNADDWTRIASVIPEFDEAKLFIDDTPAISIPEMRSKLINFTNETKELDLVVVDYLQLMTGTRTESRQQEISQISRELKSIAKEFGVPVVALSQLSRAPEGRMSDHRPLLSDLRESGSLEQDADVVVFMYRDEYYNQTEDNRGLAEMIVAKQRNGPLGTVDLAFLGHFNRFENLIMG